jgi:hypothetical protein
MTLLHLHDVRPQNSAGAMPVTLRRVMRRIGAAFRTVHRAIAAAKITAAGGTVRCPVSIRTEPPRMDQEGPPTRRG